MKPITKISTAVSAGLLAVCALASTAEASATKAIGLASAGVEQGGPPPLTGGCTVWQNYYATFAAYFAVLPSGTKAFYRFTWNFGGPGLRSKNNVHLRIRRDRWGFSDKTLWQWYSADNVAVGPGRYTPPFAYETRESIMHADATFTFDSSGVDPRCTARSQTIIG